MSVKMKGSEFSAYYNDNTYWKEGAWHDNHAIKVDGVYKEDLDELDPNSDVVLESGVVYVPTVTESGAEEEEVDMVTHFKRWRRQSKFSFISITVEKDKLESVREALRAIPGITEVKGK